MLLFGILSCSIDELQEAVPPNSEENLPQEPKIEEPTTEEVGNFTYNWVEQMQLANGLLESSENTDFVSLYDNALATLVFIQQGDLDKAENILDFFKDRIQIELQTDGGGYFQFRDATGQNGRRRWLGDNAWLLIAINNYHEASGNKRYHHMAEVLEEWIRSLQDEDGGLWGGTHEDGNHIHKVTEGITVAFNAVPGYDDFHKGILAYLEQNRWDSFERTLTAWPENPAYLYAMDLHALGQGTFEDFPENQLYKADDWYLTTQVATINGEEITGYCFDVDQDVVWLEGTAQMAVAYRKVGDLVKVDMLINELEKMFITSSMFENSKALPYTTNHGSSYGTDILWDHADIASTLSTTAWYLFAKTGFDPLQVGFQKDIPTSDKFWVTEP